MKIVLAICLALSVTSAYNGYNDQYACPRGGQPVCASNGFEYFYFENECHLRFNNLQRLLTGKSDMEIVSLAYCRLAFSSGGHGYALAPQAIYPTDDASSYDHEEQHCYHDSDIEQHPYAYSEPESFVAPTDYYAPARNDSSYYVPMQNYYDAGNTTSSTSTTTTTTTTSTTTTQPPIFLNETESGWLVFGNRTF